MSQQTLQQTALAKPKTDSKTQQASEPIRILPSRQASNHEACDCQRGRRQGRSLKINFKKHKHTHAHRKSTNQTKPNETMQSPYIRTVGQCNFWRPCLFCPCRRLSLYINPTASQAPCRWSNPIWQPELLAIPEISALSSTIVWKQIPPATAFQIQIFCG